MLALTTTACSNSERESDALADAPSEATDTNRDVPPETNEFLEGDEGHSITYIRLHDGMHMGSASAPLLITGARHQGHTDTRVTTSTNANTGTPANSSARADDRTPQAVL